MLSRLSTNPGAAASIVLAVALVGLNFIISVVTARILGADGFGIFATAIALLSLLSIPAVLGIDRIVTRNVATYHERDQSDHVRGVLRTTTRFVLASSLLIAASSTAIVLVAREWFPDPLPIVIAIAALPVLSLSRLRQSALLGLGRVVSAQVPEAIARPLTYLGGLGLVFLLGLTVSSGIAVAIYLAAAAIAFVFGTILLRRVTARILGQGEATWPAAGWWREALPMTLLSGSGLIIANLPVLVISALTGSAEAGLFAVAYRAASIQPLGLTALNTVMGPTIARLKARGDADSLQQSLSQTARLGFLLTFLLAGGMLMFRDDLLRLFGGDFGDAALPLLILTVGQLINAACGPVGTLFVMSDQTPSAAAGLVVGAVITSILLLILVPSIGVVGASMATAVGVASWNFYLVFLAWSKEQVDPTILGRSWASQ